MLKGGALNAAWQCETQLCVWSCILRGPFKNKKTMLYFHNLPFFQEGFFGPPKDCGCTVHVLL